MTLERWSHGHSLGAGVLGGLLLSQHGWTVALLAFTAGLAVGLLLHVLRRAGEAVEAWTGRTRRRHMSPAPARPRLFDQEAPETWTRTPW